MAILSEPQRQPSSRRSWYRFEAAAVALFFGLCRILPIDWASGFGGWLGPALGVTAQARRNFALPDLRPTSGSHRSRHVGDLGRVAAEYPH